MTIKELENRCGLDRATIRFYEKEGLIAPKRLSNGYRDYAEEDALALDKISLLRQLDFSLEDIRLVQSGQLPLGVALENRREGLLAQRAQADRALHIAEAIRKDGASYQTLQPKKYQDFLPPAPPKVTPALQETRYPAHGCRLRRAAARLLDQLFYDLLICLLFCYVLRVAYEKEHLWIIGIMAMPFIEPLLLCTIGWTPGKWLMGLRLRQMGELQEKPTYGQGLVRCLKLLWYGFGLFVPIFWLCRLYVSWKRGEKEQPQPWDEYDFIYTLDNRLCSVELFCASLLVLALVFGWNVDDRIYQASTRPPYRREMLTKEQYAQNVNDTLSYVFREEYVRQETDGSYRFLPGYNRNLGSDEQFSQQFQQTVTEEEGFVTAVTFDVHLDWVAEDGQMYDWEEKLIQSSIMALTGATRQQAKELWPRFSRAIGGQAVLRDWTVHMTPQQRVAFGVVYTVTISR